MTPEEYSSSDEYLTDEESVMTIERYDIKVQRAFWTDFKIGDTFTLNEDDERDQIKSMVTSFCNKAKVTSTPVHSIYSFEIISLRDFPMKTSETSIFFKAFSVSYDCPMFLKYFPDLKHYESSFQCGLNSIFQSMLKVFPCLHTSGSVNGYYGDLGRALKEINDTADKLKLLLRQQVSDDSVVIYILTRQWKGQTSTELNVIINAVKMFESKHRDYRRVFRPRAFLPHIFSGYPIGTTERIDRRFDKNFQRGKECDSLVLAQKFESELFEIVAYGSRAKVVSSATEKQSEKFWNILRRGCCTEDFWPINMI